MKMKRELRKLCSEVISVSLNPDQLNTLAQEVDKSFDLRKVSGFGHSIAIPAHAASATLVDFLNTDERIVAFLERMLKNEGRFVYDTTVKIAFKEDLLNALARERWIFDADTRTIIRDPFFAEKLNFLRELEVIDLHSEEQQKPFRIAGFSDAIHSRAESLLADQIAWQITLRLNRLSGEIPGLIHEIVSLLLGRQGLKELLGPVSRALHLLSMEARNRMYKRIFQQRLALDPVQNSELDISRMFQEELDENGDTQLSEWAECAGESFDLHFKSSDEAISAWTITHQTLSLAEKKELLRRVHPREFDEVPLDNSEFTEARESLRELSLHYDPLRLVLYPNRTKIGFFLRRDSLPISPGVPDLKERLAQVSNSRG